MMNSYFEQGGFYNQAASAAAADPSYRFPLGLASMGMPYQHQPRPQDYDVAAAAAVSAASSVTSPKSSGLYSPHNNDSSSVYKSSSTTSSNTSGGGAGATPSNPATDPASSAPAVDCKTDQSNGYSSLSKELSAWGNTTPTSGGVGGGHVSASAAAAGVAAAAAAANGGVRPSVCTPDMTRYTPSAVDAVSARDRWMNSCSLTGSQAQPQLQQSANHTFYPWMAIAGELG